MSGDGQKSASQVEAEQEAMLRAKYGNLGMKPKKKALLPKDHKFFDSADWALAKEGQQKASAVGQPSHISQPAPPAEEALPLKLEPTAVPARRVSHLENTSL